MRTKYTLSLCIATFFAAAGLWAGCTVGFDTAAGDVSFPCESDDDCIDGFECNEDDGFCENEAEPDEEEPPPPCDDSEDGIDQDGDGYGAGTDRRDCDNTERDCDDTDPTVYPGAPEQCDNKLNDCDDWPEDADNGDGQDDFSCEADGDCDPPAELGELFGRCDTSSNTCYFPPPRATTECQEDAGVDSAEELRVTCDSSQTRFTWGNDRDPEELPRSSCF